MLEEVNGVGVDFSFKKGEIYKALDGDETGVDALSGTILVRQPNSPKSKDWWCQFDKSLIGEMITVIKNKNAKENNQMGLNCKKFTGKQKSMMQKMENRLEAERKAVKEKKEAKKSKTNISKQ